MKSHIFCVLMVCACAEMPAQETVTPEIKGLRINGQFAGQFPAAMLGGKAVAIEFDLEKSQPLDFRVKFFQCDKDWNITQTQLVNDAMRNSTKFPIPYERAPIGVEHYVYHYTLRVPGFPGVEQFSFSGNYLFEIWDKELTTMLATGRFFVVEEAVPVSMVVRNRLLPSESAPMNQVNKIEVGVAIPEQQVIETDQLVVNQVRTVDVYRNRELGSPYRIDVDDNNPNTFVDGFGTGSLVFWVDNVRPGNEYRTLDLTDVDYYPPNRI
ncbi:MAG TPA: type IX secretion system plug protein domain-containing protein, partial [Bacteroidota bacterium]|nr:type IX secretion system plug protein domain-containing protein [Bacteroidota bacterium]